MAAPRAQTAWSLHAQTSGLDLVPLGCPCADRLLAGGIRRGELTELCGAAGVGKTQVALQFLIRAATQRPGPTASTLLICTEGSVPSRRIRQLAEALAGPRAHDVVTGLRVAKCGDADEMEDLVVHKLRHELAARPATAIVIDSIAAPFRGGDSHVAALGQRASTLLHIARELKRVAHEQRIAVLVLNQVSSSRPVSSSPSSNLVLTPALGLTWSNCVNCRILAKKSTRPKVEVGEGSHRIAAVPRQLQVVFSSRLPAAAAEFVITSAGVQDVP